MLREPQKHKKTKFDKKRAQHQYTTNHKKNNNNERVCVRVFKAAADTQKQQHQ